ncbi:MAG: hypothetical protein JXM70_10055 [Pirellulales bacterium]|nr:hypothetical protein [Pirellulales bacterium]
MRSYRLIRSVPQVCVLFFLFPLSVAWAADNKDAGLVGHWKLLNDCRDSSVCGNHGVNHGVKFNAAEGASFDGVQSHIEVPHSASLKLGKGDCSIAVWVHTEDKLDDVLGDILSKYDPLTRRGMNFLLMNYVGNASAQSNYKNLFFGIDVGGKPPAWSDCGRPGNNKIVWALTVFNGHLYAGTWEPGERQAGHVYRYEGGTRWIDCGAPDRCNAICTLCEHDGKLYAGSAFYSGRGSALPVSPNKNPGGKVFRYEGGKQWTDCGKIGDVYTTSALVSFDGKLYATTCDSYGCPTRTAAAYRYNGDKKWTYVGSASGRLGAFCVYNGILYATVFGEDGMARYDGDKEWISLGAVPQTSQTYSAVIHKGKICVGTWPTASVFRYDGDAGFTSLGRLGEEKEVMALAVYNGKLYGGTLPLGQVYRYDESKGWTCTGQLDTTPDVRYRRVWSMAVYDGKLFAGTLPSGHVLSLEAGKCVSFDRTLPSGWHHLAAVKAGDKLQLYLDGKCVAHSTSTVPADYDFSNKRPLIIGFGEHDYFNGKMRDLRIYNRSLDAAEIGRLAERP